MRIVLCAGAALLLPSAALGQAMTHDHGAPATATEMPPAETPSPETAEAPAEDPHAMHGGEMHHGAPGLPAGTGTAPSAATDWAADSYYDPVEMARVRAGLWREHGGARLSQVMFNLAEYQVRQGRDGYRWDGEGWFGGDLDRLVVRSEGDGRFGQGVDRAEVQALYSRAIGPYFNLQAGIRQDLSPHPARTHAVLGVEGLAPYWFDVAAAVFLSTTGDVLARVEGYYDQRITQRLILQPRVELNLAAQDVPENGIGAGLSDAELGLRLRYEITREFAPYVGVTYDRAFGGTARLARRAGDGTGAASLVAGVRIWF